MAASWRDAEVRGDNESRLVIEPSRGYFRIAWGLMAAGGLAAPLVVLVHGQQVEGRAGAWLIGGALVAVGTAMMALRRRFVFDREAGMLWMRPGLKARELPLSEVRAIQVVSGGCHATSRSSFATYQLNLVLGHECPERVNVSNQPDLDWSVEAGARLAKFLDVPLFDPAGRGARLRADHA